MIAKTVRSVLVKHVASDNMLRLATLCLTTCLHIRFTAVNGGETTVHARRRTETVSQPFGVCPAIEFSRFLLQSLLLASILDRRLGIAAPLPRAAKQICMILVGCPSAACGSRKRDYAHRHEWAPEAALEAILRRMAK